VKILMNLFLLSRESKKIMVKARWYSLAEQWELPFLIWREKIN